MRNFTKYYHIVIAALLIVGATFFIGVYVGKEQTKQTELADTLTNKEQNKPPQTDFSPFWKAWNILNEKYIPSGTSSKPISDEKKVWGAIMGLTESLDDPYTVFLPPIENELFETEISGNFEGVGMEIGVRDDILTIVAPLKGTPAYRAGLLPGDKIIEINGVTTAKLNTEEAVKLIRGKRGTEVVLKILRNGNKEPFNVSVLRDRIDIPTIETEKLAGGIFVIRLYNFSAASPNLFRGALRQFINARTNKLILDLRGNPGGYLEAAIDIASWFLPSGKVIVKEDFKDNGQEVIHTSKGYNIVSDGLKFAILIDGGSASASEILAGALQEQGVATLVGTKSYGKGSVQELIKITPDTSLKVTIARWLTPLGNSISDGGLTPDIIVKRTPEDAKSGKDPQQDKAVEFLLGK